MRMDAAPGGADAYSSPPTSLYAWRRRQISSLNISETDSSIKSLPDLSLKIERRRTTTTNMRWRIEGGVQSGTMEGEVSPKKGGMRRRKRKVEPSATRIRTRARRKSFPKIRDQRIEVEGKEEWGFDVLSPYGLRCVSHRYRIDFG